MNRNGAVMPCGHILAFVGDVAILCTKDNGHEGKCDSKMFQFVSDRELMKFALEVL